MRVVLAAALVVGCYGPTVPAGAPCPDGVCPSGLVCSPATQTCERVAGDAAAGDAVDPPRDAGPDATVKTFMYRRRITIKNNGGTSLPAGLAMRVPFTALATAVMDNKIKADLSDLRVIGDGAIGERDRIIDGPSGPAPSAVSFTLGASIAAGATSSEYSIYYGAPTAGAAPANGGAVFTIYDDFTSGISNVWLKNDGPTVTSGSLVLRAAHVDALTTNAASDGVPITSAIELVATIQNPQSDPTPQPEGTFWYWFGYQHTGDFSASSPWIVWISRSKGTLHAEQNSPTGCEAQCNGPDLGQNTAAHYYAIERDPGATRFYFDGALSAAITVTNSADYSPMVRNYMATSDVRIDWIRVRARVTPEPTVTLGSEEML